MLKDQKGEKRGREQSIHQATRHTQKGHRDSFRDTRSVLGDNSTRQQSVARRHSTPYLSMAAIVIEIRCLCEVLSGKAPKSSSFMAMSPWGGAQRLWLRFRKLSFYHTSKRASETVFAVSAFDFFVCCSVTMTPVRLFLSSSVSLAQRKQATQCNIISLCVSSVSVTMLRIYQRFPSLDLGPNHHPARLLPPPLAHATLSESSPHESTNPTRIVAPNECELGGCPC